MTTSTEPRTTEPKYDFFSEQFFADPFDMYAEMRREDPVWWHPLLNMWVLTRYDDIRTVCREPAFSAERTDSYLAGLEADDPDQVATIRAFFLDWLVLIDPPRHTRIRKLMTKAFAPKQIAAMEPDIAAIVDEQLDQLEAGTTVNLIEEFSLPIPLKVITDMLGVDRADTADFKRWVDESFQVVTLVGDLKAKLQAAYTAIEALNGLFHDRIAARRREPKDDILSVLVNANEDGDALTEQEITSTCAMLLVAGHETSSNLIGNTVLSLLRHRDQLEKLKDRPELIRATIEEALRFEGAAAGMLKLAVDDCELSGQRIAKGDLLLAITQAANRDPDVFENPDVFDIERENLTRHVAFAHGIHSCMGAALARLETKVAVSSLFERFPNLDFGEGERKYAPSLAIRGMSEFPVAL